MIAKLAQAVQAQQKLINDLTARIAELEPKNLRPSKHLIHRVL
jgi:hypothetical protein